MDDAVSAALAKAGEGSDAGTFVMALSVADRMDRLAQSPAHSAPEGRRTRIAVRAGAVAVFLRRMKVRESLAGSLASKVAEEFGLGPDELTCLLQMHATDWCRYASAVQVAGTGAMHDFSSLPLVQPVLCPATVAIDRSLHTGRL